MNTAKTIKAEGSTYTRIWDALTKDRRANFFCADLEISEGATVRFWRRRDGIKTTIRTCVTKVENSTPTIKKYFVEETNEEDED